MNNKNQFSYEKIIEIVSFIIAAIFIILGIKGIPRIFTALTNLFHLKIIFGLFYLVSAVLNVIAPLLVAAALLVLGAKVKESQKSEVLFSGVIASGILYIVLKIASGLILGIGKIVTSKLFSFWKSSLT